jgi:hypothetical protein
MPHVGRLHRYTYADYIAVEMESATKHEFLDGEIYAMAGSPGAEAPTGWAWSAGADRGWQAR